MHTVRKRAGFDACLFVCLRFHWSSHFCLYKYCSLRCILSHTPWLSIPSLWNVLSHCFRSNVVHLDCVCLRKMVDRSHHQSEPTLFTYLTGNAEEVPGDRQHLGRCIPIPIFTSEGSNLSKSAWSSLSEASVEDRHSQLSQSMLSQRDDFSHELFESSTAPSQDVGAILACLYAGSFSFTGWSPSSLSGPHHKKDDFVTLYPRWPSNFTHCQFYLGRTQVNK